MIRRIVFGGELLAIIIDANFDKQGIEFFTPPDYSQQIAYMHRPEGYAIEPHTHRVIRREVLMTQEVLLIKRGKVRVDFYDTDQNYLKSHVLSTGDIILLAAGGHGFVMLEESEIIEVKQGPYAGEKDKVRFKGVEDSDICGTE